MDRGGGGGVTLARLQATVGADTGDFTAGMASVRGTLLEFPQVARTASDRAATALTSADEAAKGLGRAFAGLTVAGVAFGVGMKALDLVGEAMSFVADSAIGMNNRLEQAKIGFTTMLGSAQAADVFLKGLADFAAKTPFSFPGLVETSQRMLALGFASQQVVPMLTAVGNAAAALGTGQAGIDRITTALGQMQARTRVSADEMRQLTEAGVPAWQLLADSMGVSVAELQKMTEAGKVNAGVFIDAFQAYSKMKYGDMMAVQARTFGGAMTTIVDSAGMAIAKGARPLFDRISAGAVQIADFVTSARFEKWATDSAKAMEAVGKEFDKLGPALERDLKTLEAIGVAYEKWIAFRQPLEDLFDSVGLSAQRNAERSAAATIQWGEGLDRVVLQTEQAAIATEKLSAASKKIEDPWAKFRGADLSTIAASFTDFIKPEEFAKEANKLVTSLEQASAAANAKIESINREAAESMASAVEARNERVGEIEARTAVRLAEVIVASAAKVSKAERDAADDYAAAATEHSERVVAAQEAATNARTEAIQREGERMNAALDDANQATRDAIAGAAEREADLRADAGRRLIDAQEDAARRIIDQTQRADESRADAIERSAERLADVAKAAEEKHGDVEARKAATIIAATAKYADATAAAIALAGERIVDEQRSVADAIESAVADLALDRTLRAQRDIFDAGQDLAARSREQARDDADARYDYERDLGEAQTEEERRQVEQRFVRAEAARSRRRGLAEEDRAFADAQDEERRAFEDRLADEALTRAAERMQTDSDARIAAIEAELVRRRAALDESFQADIDAAIAAALAGHTAAREAAAETTTAIEAELAKRLAAIAVHLAKDVAATRAALVEKERELREALARDLIANGEALAKRQEQIAARRREALADAATDRAQRIIEADAELARDLAALDKQLGDKRAKIGERLSEERTAVALAAKEKNADLAAAYTDDVAAADLALSKKLADVAKRAGDERRAVADSLADRQNDIWAFVARLPREADLPTDRFTERLWTDLERNRLKALELLGALERLADVPAPPAYPGQLPQPNGGTVGYVDGVRIRDRGGHGAAGEPALIGKGAQPELFVPDSAGSYYPAGTYGGSAPIQITVPLQIGDDVIARVVATVDQRNHERGMR